MMYHKNRLIKAYERVGCQLKVSILHYAVIHANWIKHNNLFDKLQANNKGVRVIGVIECNFLDPTHNKQGFEENDKYR